MAKDTTKYIRPDTGTEFQTEYALASEKTLYELKNQLQILNFSGVIYTKQMTMTADTATRFETSTKLLRDIVIIVNTEDMLLGSEITTIYPVGAGETVGFTKVDISTLYFKNAGAGANGTITILAVEE